VIVLIDNYDSFVHNLARYLRRLGERTVTVRNDEVGVDDVAALAPSHIVISPGPCSPAEAGISPEVVTRLGAAVPILGVCLGHQCIAAAYGGRIVRARRPTHGRATAVSHTGAGIFEGLPSPFQAGLYHSLAVAREDLPAELEVVAVDDAREIMAIRHRQHPVWGVQFHPESILTEHGPALLRNFLSLGAPAGAAVSAGREPRP